MNEYLELKKIEMIKEAEENLACLAEELQNILTELDLAIKHLVRSEVYLKLAKASKNEDV